MAPGFRSRLDQTRYGVFPYNEGRDGQHHLPSRPARERSDRERIACDEVLREAGIAMAAPVSDRILRAVSFRSGGEQHD